MKASKETWSQFYQHVARVFYAIAAADKKVQPEEVQTMTELVHKKWTNLEESKDLFGSDAAMQIESVFDWLTEEHANSMEALKEFRDFKEQNEALFTESVKKLIFETADAIASSCAGKNKSELVILTELNMILNKK